MKHGKADRSWIFAGVCGALAALSATGRCEALSWSDYTVQQGDTIEIEVAGLPELHQRSTVQPDGAIAFPLVGAMRVEGLTPPQLREQVQKELAHKIYRQRANDGREVLVVIQPDEVSASIVAYRPIYVIGDVAKSGELTFRPEMTARQAIALAGGVDTPPLRSGDPAREAAQLRNDRELALVELAKALAVIARLNAELTGADKLVDLDFSAIPLPKERLADLTRLQSDGLQADLADARREREFLQSVVKQADSRIAAVQKQQDEEEQGAAADTAELQRLTTLLSRGQEISPRVTEARRALLLSSTRALQVSVELMELQRQRAEALRKTQRFDDERRIGLLKDLQEAAAAAEQLRVKRQGYETALRLLPNAPTFGQPGADLQSIDVIRQSGSHSTRTQADGDTILAPGDVVEVRLLAADPQAAPIR